jgi:predicted nucleic acid-binding protein
MKSVVCNASPLIILARAGYLDFLHNQFDRIFVPQAVLNEIMKGPDDDAIRGMISKLSWIEQVQLEPPLSPLAYFNLGRGESEVIEYARTHFTTIALLDDRAARKIAAALQVPVHGTLSIIAREVVHHGLISFDAAVMNLRKSGLYIDDRIVQIISEALKTK